MSNGEVAQEQTLTANPNFAGAGESTGLEIWRVEVGDGQTEMTKFLDIIVYYNL